MQVYCGNTKEHCAAPDCQINYSPGCDANKTPYGTSTANDVRRQLGSVQYGGLGIRECLKPKTVAITYDDGPYIYTEQVMAQFEARNAHATFFVTGNNLGKGSIDEKWTGVISKMHANGHQIASHTWSHQNLDQITHEQRIDQMVKNEMAIRNIIGKYPTYMRPPYSACESTACQADMATLGYVVTSFDLDTDDYNQLTTEKIQVAKDNFKKGLDTAAADGDRLAIAHDIHELTALNLTGYMLDYVYRKGWTAVTVGECMNDPVANWYRDSTPGVKPSATPSSSVPVPTPTGPTSLDGSCGGPSGQSCIGFKGPDGFSECCSPAGYCGNKEAYCGTGCNPLFGKCGTQPSVSATPTSAAPLPTVSLETSTTGECGTTVGKTCRGFLLGSVKAECCSEYNYCGSTEGYCGTGCNPLYGNCGSPGSSSSASIFASASTSTSISVSSFAPVSSSTSASHPSIPSSASIHSISSHPSSATSFSSAYPSEVHSSSASASTHKSSSTAESKTPVHVSTSGSTTPSASISKHDSTIFGHPTTIPNSDTHSTHTPSPASSTPISKENVYSTSSPAPIHPNSSPSAVNSNQSNTKVYPSTWSTIVRPSSTPCDDDPVPSSTPSQPPVSKNGKCGKDNGGQTCKSCSQP
jgi:hypothetical protein